MSPAVATAEAEKRSGPVQSPDWKDFREHLATADKQGRRRWLYPRKPEGRWHRRRMWVSWVLLAVLFAGPFVRIGGKPLLMLNILERKFSILGQLFWPSDFVIFVIASLIYLVGIMIFTTAFGRVWCGWTCPQTLLMEMVFRKIEYAIEGNSAAQRALNAAPWNGWKALKKLSKHAVFFALSWIIGNTLLAYLIGSEQLLEIITDHPRKHLVGLGFMGLFTLVFYAIFARFREQACTFICPYGRFMSATMDENTLLVAYDYKRGERRGRLRQGESWKAREEQGGGDCINCRACVAVCPTGIDIRNGTQMECVNCTACIDACDAIMRKVGRPSGLIRFASENSIEYGGKLRFTPRMGLYSAALAGLAVLLVVLIATRGDVNTILLRAPGALYTENLKGEICNLYTLKVLNKTSDERAIELKIENMPGTITLMGNKKLNLRGDSVAQGSVLISLHPNSLAGASTRLKIGVYADGERLEVVETVFAGPRRPHQP